MNIPSPQADIEESAYSLGNSGISAIEVGARALEASRMEPRARKTRIVATLGPASSSPEMIRQLYLAGADVFRLNMSHGSQEQKIGLFNAIRHLESEYGRPTTILVDLQGPKLRIGRFVDGSAELGTGSQFQMDQDPAPGNCERVCLPHPELLDVLHVGAQLLIDDGKIVLRVVSVAEGKVGTYVEVGGRISDNKGVNVPDVIVPLPALTDKDRADLAFALDMQADWIALSFVQQPEDLAEARALIGDRAALLAKIEKPSAVTNLAAIIERSDGLMVARGDLGVEIPAERLPPIQKQIVHLARLAGRPVIVATQMLESMIGAPTATRAEVSDVATAIYDGADAIMLSAESAAGAWPVKSVALLDRIARSVEADARYPSLLLTLGGRGEHGSGQALGSVVASGAAHMAEAISAQAIACFTASGASAIRLARERPRAAVLVATPDLRVARRLGLLWAAHPVCVADIASFDEMIERGIFEVRRAGLGSTGSPVLIVAGVPFGSSGSTNVVHVTRV